MTAQDAAGLTHRLNALIEARSQSGGERPRPSIAIERSGASR